MNVIHKYIATAMLPLVLLLCATGCMSVRLKMARDEYLSVGRVYDPKVREWMAAHPEETCRYFQSDGRHGSVLVPPPQGCQVATAKKEERRRVK